MDHLILIKSLTLKALYAGYRKPNERIKIFIADIFLGFQRQELAMLAFYLIFNKKSLSSYNFSNHLPLSVGRVEAEFSISMKRTGSTFRTY
jgi:hypothetical protein